MGKPNRLTTVRAQRKYAHKAHMPCRSEVEPMEVEPSTSQQPQQPALPQPTVMVVRKPIGDIINKMAFQNIHEHPENLEEKLMDVRIILKRVDSPKDANVSGVQETNNLPLDTHTDTTDEEPDTQNIIAKKNKAVPKALKIRRRDEGSICNLRLRNRMITRNWLMSRRPDSSDSTNDDNRPLTYYAMKKKQLPSVQTTDATGNKKSRKNPAKNKLPTRPKPKRKRRAAKKKTKAKKAHRVMVNRSRIAEDLHTSLDITNEINDELSQIYSEIEEKITIEEHELPSPIDMEPLVLESSSYSESWTLATPTEEPVVLESSSYSEHQPLENPTEEPVVLESSSYSEPRPLENPTEDISIISNSNVMVPKCDPESSPSDNGATSSTQSVRNALADFIINIFNDVNGGLELDAIKAPDSQSRVEEWLGQNTSNEETNNPFKIPAPPQWREKPTRRSSILKSIKEQINATEIELRRRCLAWDYQRLSGVYEDRTLLRQFCGGCTRCRVMFTPDVYSCNDVSDDEGFRLEARTVLSRISEDINHVIKFQNFMSEKGKIICRIATLIKNKLLTNASLLHTEDKDLRQVIVILSQCNTPRNSDLYAGSHRRSSQLALSRQSPNLSEIREREAVLVLQQSNIYHPSLTEFAENPIAYVCKIRKEHPKLSLCGIVPPSNFKPVCKIDQKFNNFKLMNQYIHRMLTRWGEATRELSAIRSIQSSNVSRYPLFEGLEVDLHKLFHTVQKDGGLEAAQNNNAKWRVIAQKMKLYCRNKASAKLENIYLKHLLSYNALTPDERKKNMEDVNKCWAQREIKSVVRAQNPLYRQDNMLSGKRIDDDTNISHLEKVCAEAEECVALGRYINYNNFEKLAQQVHGTYFPDNLNPSPDEVEHEYWKIVISANAHVCVHVASVDAVEHQCGFTNDEVEFHGTHPWNLKRMHQNSSNLLSHLGPTLGVSSTTVHYGMMFSTSCWHMDPTSVPWIEYLHAGPPKIWYSISADQEQKFRAAAEALCPFAVQNKGIWLPCDIIMIPPSLLRQYGITVNRHVQRRGEYVVVYPNTYSACIDTGFTVSEGVYFAPHDWIVDIERIYLNLRNSCEPSLFSMEQLLIAMARSEETPFSLLQRVHTVLVSQLRAELSYRQSMADKNIELISPEVFLEQNQRATKASWQIQQNTECAFCRCHIHLSRVVGVPGGETGLCSMHGIQLFENAVSRSGQLSGVFCITLVSNTEIYGIIETLKQRMLSSISDPI